MIANIEEFYPDDPQPGDLAVRVVTYTDEGLPIWEAYVAEFKILEIPGDYPRIGLELDVWIQHGYGVGSPPDTNTITEEYLDDCDSHSN